MVGMAHSEAIDVAVVGAGPAGSAAAITLARLGRRVTLIDKATFPRDKCCGDGLTTAALRRLEHLGLDPAAVRSWEPVDGAVVVPTSQRRIDLPFPSDGTLYAASARRADLDAALVERAVRAGAELKEGCRVTAVQPLGEPGKPVGVTLDLAGGQRITAHYLIAADGAWSTTRRAVGVAEPRYLGDWQAGRQYFRDVGPQARKLWVWFEPDLIPGYAWSFPLPGNTANVGYGVLRRPGHRLADARGQRLDFMARPHIADVLGAHAKPNGPWKAWPIPARIGESPTDALAGRVLFAGDAARACDPMTGEGIAQALETAELAALAIAEAGPSRPRAAAARYRRQLRWGMALDDHLARKLSGVLARQYGSVIALELVDARPWRKRNFLRWMFEDYPRAVVVTPHRWHRRMFNRPGAYASA
jgi:geranylgeranyl reductase family protein